jgi:hypothetical protein
LNVSFLLPHVRKIRPFVLDVIGTEDLTPSVGVQKTEKVGLSGYWQATAGSPA